MVTKSELRKILLYTKEQAKKAHAELDVKIASIPKACGGAGCDACCYQMVAVHTWEEELIGSYIQTARVLFPAGTTVNPFDYEKLSKTLLFLDARDKGQVEFAKRFLSSAKGLVKPILVGGEPLKLMREWKREIFYDQGGALTRRFSITQSPAVVSQEGKRLRVDEIRL